MKVGSLTVAMQRATTSINNTFSQLEKNASIIAAGVENDSQGSEKDVSRALAENPALHQQVAANARVIDTADRLLDELASKPRR